jgi:nucleotide-binding universal stress UspA family protein
MYQRIYVPVDSSPHSTLALNEAIKLAKSLGSTLILAHSVDLPRYGRGNPAILDSKDMDQPLIDDGKEILRRAVALAHAQGLIPESELLENRGESIATLLLEDAHDCKADLIIMGTHGRTGLMHLLLGSVAEGVLRVSDLPVLLIRPDK